MNFYVIILCCFFTYTSSFASDGFLDNSPEVQACKGLAEYAAKVELGQDLNFVSATSKLYENQKDFTLSSNQVRVQIIVTEEGETSGYEYAATVSLPISGKEYSCVVTEIESIH